jgi:PTS system galactitol-specific IIC component
VDLAVLPFMVVTTIPITRGNVFKTVIIAGGLLVGNNLSPLFTKAAIQAQFNMPSGATQISSICDGSNPLNWLMVKLMNNGFSIAILIAIFFLFLYFYKKYEKSWGIIAGASKEYLEKSE